MSAVGQNVQVEEVGAWLVVREGSRQLVAVPRAIAVEIAEGLLPGSGYELQGEMVCPTCLGDIPPGDCVRADVSCITGGGVGEVLVFEIVGPLAQ